MKKGPIILGLLLALVSGATVYIRYQESEAKDAEVAQAKAQKASDEADQEAIRKMVEQDQQRQQRIKAQEDWPPYNSLSIYNAEDLAREFLKNTVRFDQEYSYKQIRIKGKVDGVYSRQVRFYPGSFLTFEMNLVPDGIPEHDQTAVQASIHLADLNEGDLVEMVAVYKPGDVKADQYGTILVFHAIDLRKLPKD